MPMPANVPAKMPVIQIVRRFGRVGGMESYVWHLVHELAASGNRITVICERAHEEPSALIQVIELGEVAPKPRWISLLRFSARVGRQIRALNPGPDTIIHSHERTGVHHVTTFHGPPFAHVRDKPFYKLISLRIWAQLFLERRELCGTSVRVVIPNSRLISERLAHYYPCVQARLVAPVAPGVPAIPPRVFRALDSRGGTIGFVGKEWKRKGLAMFLKIAAALLSTRPNLKLLILGPQRTEITHLLKDYAGKVNCPGWQDSTPYYQQMDLLIHPALMEPYGMVVAEAMAAGVPVVISDQCGVAADVASANGSVLSLDASDTAWVQACRQWLDISGPPPGFSRTWQQVAEEHLDFYRKALEP
jgi:UDP-glucose:(heptosyl)LPS alpha-1,3-glucosyltransferase